MDQTSHQRGTCVNLRERFGKRYRISFDSAYSPRHVPRHALDPWAMEIPTRCGSIYPIGGALLVAEVEGHAKMRNRLAALACVTTYQDGDRFGAFKFDVSDFDQVAKIIRPHRRRIVTERERDAARERMLALRQRRKAVCPDA